MRKDLFIAIAFMLFFCVSFLLVQSVLHYRWSGEEDLYTRNLDYAKHPEGSIDVLCIGTSELYTGYDPIVTYEEEGITGYNFAMSYSSAVPFYYQLMYALEYQTPKIVLCDFKSLYDDCLPSETEPLYRKVVGCMPDRSIRNLLIKDICTIDTEQSYLSWKIPLLRYHSMWNELDEENFQSDYVYNESYPAYAKGSLLEDVHFDGEIIDITPELWDYTEPQTIFSEVSVYYYDKMIEECKNRGIEVVAVLPPKIGSASDIASKWDAMNEYFDSRGVHCLNYNTYEQVKRLGVVLENDYEDKWHLNIHGSIKFSRLLAQDLKGEFDLMDHRGDDTYREMWDEPLREFEKIYDLSQE